MRLATRIVVLSICALFLSPLLEPLSARAGAIVSASNSRVTDNNQLDAWVGEPDIASQNGVLYAAWRDARRTGSQVEADIVFARSSDGGASWSANSIVSNSQYVGFTDNPSISVSPDGTIWIAWGLDACYDVSITCGGSQLLNDVRVAWSFNGGATWNESGLWNGTPGSLSDSLVQRPELVATNAKIWTILHDPTFSNGDLIGFDIVLHEIVRNGTNLSSSYKLLTPTSSGKINALGGPLEALAVNGSVVCAAWEDQRDNASIYGTCSTNGAVSFPVGARWSTNGSDTAPRLAFAPDGRLYLSYRDVEKKDIVIRTSTDNGVTWSAPASATLVGSAYTFEYDLAVGPDGQMVLPVAIGALSTADKTDLELVTSIDGGQSFALNGPLESGNEPYLSTSTQHRVAVTTSGSANDARVHTIWADDRGDPLVTQNLIWSATSMLDSIAPTVPAHLRTTDGDTSVLLEWDASSDASGVASYNILRATNAAGPYTRMNALPTTLTYYRDVGLAAGTYFYRVAAVDGTGNASAASSEVSGSASVGGALTGLNGTLAYDKGGSVVGIRALNAGVLGGESTFSGAFPNYSTDGQRLYFRSTAPGLGTILSGDRTGQNAQVAFSDAQPIGEFDLPINPNFIAGVFQDDFNGACVPFEARLVQVAPRATQSSTSNTNVASISVSPDHRWVAYTNRLYCTLAGTVQYDSNRLCLVDTQAVAFTETCLDPANVQGSDFANSGNTLVFSANFTGQNEIWRAVVSGNGALSQFVQLTRGATGQPSTRPRVSSDGNWVGFLRDVDAGSGENLQAFVVRLDGESVRALGFSASSIAWSGGGPAGPIPGISRVYLPLLRR